MSLLRCAPTKLLLQEADELARDGIDAEVIDLRTLCPLDSDTICQSVGRTGRLVVAGEVHAAHLADREIFPVNLGLGHQRPPDTSSRLMVV